ncbi:hypothetical protein M514_04794 [Trichuris suis]|uniref:Uncharacterized protein n=1 Tax=Trichuris suis TaxID=68888 RepID=A0A085NUP9_9BILA|nr:hypothetical protein M513_04794 [Trichuris suis]KFD73195.1 hypothetical protein M514_04794 [Trichuris suis]
MAFFKATLFTGLALWVMAPNDVVCISAYIQRSPVQAVCLSDVVKSPHIVLWGGPMANEADGIVEETQF